MTSKSVSSSSPFLMVISQPASYVQIVNDLPPEMLSRIFLQLPYTALLKVQRVCKRWNAIVGEDPALAVQLFKKKSSERWAIGELAAEEDDRTEVPVHEIEEIHPAAQIVCVLGRHGSPKPEPNNDSDTWPCLVDLSIANDFIAIPSVTTVHVKSELSSSGPESDIKITNKDGVRVVDVFEATVKEAMKTVKRGFGEDADEMTHFRGLGLLWHQQTKVDALVGPAEFTSW
ncbi:hypothetical protein C8F01DRAFT_1088795 [Mycena amicta]|nr:hypothetical protein C8F01DRAFT_1088795 [Mycena amicta]